MEKKIWTKKDIHKGTSDYSKLRDSNRYYVDKTQLIADIMDNPNEVYIITRPRRFGKSLNLSMLDCYFNQKYKNNTWFDGLKISERKDLEIHKNAYPVICIDYKDLGNSYEEFVDTFRIKIFSLYGMQTNVCEFLDESKRNKFDSIRNGTCTIGELKWSLRLLSEFIHEAYGKKPIVLIDEYDNPMHRTYGKKDHRKILDFMRDMLSSVLKDNPHLEFAVITGVMQISKESIFSGLNNVTVNNIFSTQFDECFGFTDNEVKKICEDFGYPEKYEEAKEWYDGYRFGNADVYNPWSLMSYVENDFLPGSYWAGTSRNDIIDSMLAQCDKDAYVLLKSLSEGVSITKSIDSSISFDDLQDPNALFSVLVTNGYLKAERNGNSYLLSMPNGEIYKVFGEKILKKLLSDDHYLVKDFTDALESGDVDGMTSALGNIFKLSAGFNMLNDERSYQSFITGILMNLLGKYIIKSDYEIGNGRCDISLISKYPNRSNAIIEIKKGANTTSPEKAVEGAKKALNQIVERDYIYGLKGNIFLYGIFFAGKEPYIESTILQKGNGF